MTRGGKQPGVTEGGALPFGKNKEDLSSVFYSELVAEAYQTLGLLDEKKPSN